MKFSDVIEQSCALLQRTGRITYRSLKREFALDDEALEDLKFELIERAAQSGARELGEAGLDQLREGLAAWRATGAELLAPLFLGALAQGYVQSGQAEDGLKVIAEALALVEKNDERFYEAELYRIAGALSLRIGERETRRTGDEKIAHPPIRPFLSRGVFP